MDQLIHIDVRRDERGEYRVESSIDGAKFSLQYLCTGNEARRDAEMLARALVQGIKLTGHFHIRATSGGYNL